jgi:hypothetical protein
VFHLSTPSTPSLARNVRWRGFPLSTHHHQPLPCSNCEKEGFSVNTPSNPLACSKREMKGVFPLLTPSTLSLARNVRRRGFPLLMHHHQPLSCSNCEMEGFSVNTPPPPPSLARNVRWRGCFLCRCPPPLPHSKLCIICIQCIFLVLCPTG